MGIYVCFAYLIRCKIYLFIWLFNRFTVSSFLLHAKDSDSTRTFSFKLIHISLDMIARSNFMFQVFLMVLLYRLSLMTTWSTYTKIHRFLKRNNFYWDYQPTRINGDKIAFAELLTLYFPSDKSCQFRSKNNSKNAANYRKIPFHFGLQFHCWKKNQFVSLYVFFLWIIYKMWFINWSI